MSDADPYLLGYSQKEQERLERQAQELAPDSQWLFDQVGISNGSRVIEIGCGPRGCLELLSERVGSTGSVIGVERNAEEVKRAQQFIADNRLTNVQVENVRDRLVSTNVITERELNELMAALKRHVEDPETEAFSGIFIQAWGRRSGE